MNARALLARPLIRALLLVLGLVVVAVLVGRQATPEGRPSGTASGPVELPAATLAYMRSALDAYERIRAALADDGLDDVAPAAHELAASLEAGREAVGPRRPELTDPIARAAAPAARLTVAADLHSAREAFAEVSRNLVALAAAEPRLRQGAYVFECPMVEGFDRWIQRTPELENPYMGRRMPGCGAVSTWRSAATAAHLPAPHEIAHHTCPMHPSVRSEAPGACPICGMDLTPVTRAGAEGGVLQLDAQRLHRIGVTTSAVKVAPLDLSFRAFGRVKYDETSLVEVTLKVDGFVHRLRASATGQPVRTGELLFTLYSPALYAAQQELLVAHAAAPGGALVRAARRKLELLGVSTRQVDEVVRRGAPIENLPFLSPASGYVIEKQVVQGAAVQAGQPLFRIAGLDRVWVEAEVFEQHLPLVKPGQVVTVDLPHDPEAKGLYRAEVAYVYPALDAATRTGRVRVELPNPGHALKPDMYAEVRFELAGGERLQVPEAAVVYTGPRRVVFVDRGEGRLEPRDVKLGRKGRGTYEVLEGLSRGQRVVTSGTFLVAAESRIRTPAAWSEE